MSEIIDFFQKLFDPTDFPARWNCGEWSNFHGWLYIGSNLAIWAAYYTIPVILLYFVLKKQAVPFKRVFLWFILFITFCGITHLIDAGIFWVPHYRLNALFLFLTAIVSWVAVFLLIQQLPGAFKLKSSDELQRIIEQQTRELSQANRNLRESEQRIKYLIDDHPDIIARIDSKENIKFINKAIIHHTGQKPEQLIGKPFTRLLANADQQALIRQELHKLYQSREVQYCELKVARKELNTDTVYAVTLIPLMYDGHEVRDVLSINRDITLQRQAENEMKRTIYELQQLSRRMSEKNRRLEDFAHIVSHNLRSPIGNMKALFNLYDHEDEAKKPFLVNKIRTVSEKLSATVDDLTEIVKIHGNNGINREQLYFEAVLSHLKESLSAQIMEHDVEIIHDFKECPFIIYPKVYLESVILNLLTNAIKYRSPRRKPVIHLKSANSNGSVLLQCSDNGLGLDLDKYGDKLFRMNSTFHENQDARGVGLFITRNQVESMGGSIRVESEVDVGTTFTITFNEKENMFNIIDKLWVIDDDDIFKYTLQREIAAVNLIRKVSTFPNGKMALDQLKELLERNQFDELPNVIFLDIEMPVMDGWKFLESFSRLSSRIPIPVFVISSTVQEHEIERIRQYEGVQYYPKPIDKNRVIDICDQINTKKHLVEA